MRKIRKALVLACVFVLSSLSGFGVDAVSASPPSGFGNVVVSSGSWLAGNGVDVFSNGSSSYFCPNDGSSGINCSNYVGSTYVGIKWQCVELAQRLYTARGWHTGSFGVSYAYEIWGRASAMGMSTYGNGGLNNSNVLPGDMIVWNTQVGYAGHVAVVDSVSGSNVYVKEQNWGGSGQTGQATYSLGNGYLSGHGYSSGAIYGIVHSPNNHSGGGGGGGVDTQKPTASWAAPSANSTISSRSVTLQANASDSGGSGLKEIHFNAKWSGTWHGLSVAHVSGSSASPNYSWDMCASGVSDGDIELGLEAYDNAGNSYVYSEHQGNPHITKRYSCNTTPPPGIPGNKAATAISPTQIQLSWSQATYVSGYRIKRWAGGDNWPVIADNLRVGTSSYPDTGLATNTTYWYYICGFNSTGEACGDFVSARTPQGVPAGPSNLAAAGTGTNAVRVTWTDQAGNEDDYRVKRAAWNGSSWDWPIVATLGQNASGYTDTDVSPGNWYDYLVCPHNAVGETCVGFVTGWTLCDVPSGAFCAEYYNNTTLDRGPTFDRRESYPLNRSWGTDSPGTGIGNDGFSVRWQGAFSFASATYRFAGLTDDGMKIWIDGVSVFDEWRGDQVLPFSFDRAMSAGSHSLKIEYFEQAGSATAQLSWSPLAPGNDNLAGAPLLAGSTGSVAGTNGDATPESGEPATCTVRCGPARGPYRTVWYRWVAPGDGRVTFDTCTNNFDTMLAVYTGSAYPLTKVTDSDDDCATGNGSSVIFNVVSGATYRLQVDSFSSSSSGTFTLGWQFTPPAPPNDDIGNPLVVTGSGGWITGTNLYATVQSGEPSTCLIDCGGDQGPNATVWYRWVAPSDGSATFDTCTNTAFDTLLSVYTGSGATLTRLVDNDDDCGTPSGTQSRITFDVTAGTPYLFQVDGYSIDDTGSFTLTWQFTPPPAPGNDNLNVAQFLTGSAGSVDGTNADATSEPGEPATCTIVCGSPHGPNHTVWYQWVAPDNGSAAFDTCTATFDTLLGVYTGTNYPLTKVTDSDDNCASGLGSRAVFNVFAGTTYLVQVDSYSASFPGSFTLAWHFSASAAAALSISDASVLEGSRKHHTVKLVFIVTLSQALSGRVTVHYATVDDTAKARRDYEVKSGTLTIVAGHVTGRIVVLVKSDKIVEPNETLQVNLSNGSIAAIEDGQGVGTIINDD